MRKAHFPFLAFVLIVSAGHSPVFAQQQAIRQTGGASTQRAHLATAHFKKLGMMCMVCHQKVVQAVSEVSGVIKSRVDLNKDDVIVTYDPHKTSAKSIAAAIARAGFRPRS